MIEIIYGEDTAKSRNYFIAQKKQYSNHTTINGAIVSLTEIMQIFEGNELFTIEKYIFIEDFFSKRKKNKETEEIIKIINQNQKDAKIYFWESKEITPKQGKQFENAITKQFKLPQTLFAFLDGVKPNNGKALVQLFQQTLADEDSQFLLVMLIRQFRLLLAIFQPSENAIEEIKRMAPWQKDKLRKQAAVFSLDRLQLAFGKLYQLEYGVKTGTLPIPLEHAIDFFLMEL